MTELLIVGALAIDRFADGRAVPGGSVLHAGEAAVAEGATPTFLTVAGDEPEARAGLARLTTLGNLLHQPAARTVTYRHDERAGRRLLVYEASTEPIAVPGDLVAPEVVLLAPIADELPAAAASALQASLRPRGMVMLVQGWLRRLDLGAAVRPMPLAEVPDELWSAFGRADAVVASTEDLSDAPGDPFSQAAELRARVGEAPILVLTLGTDGYLLDDPADRPVRNTPPRVIENVPMVGAGDMFGAAFALHLGRGVGAERAAFAATAAVIRVLEERAG